MRLLDDALLGLGHNFRCVLLDHRGKFSCNKELASLKLKPSENNAGWVYLFHNNLPDYEKWFYNDLPDCEKFQPYLSEIVGMHAKCENKQSLKCYRHLGHIDEGLSFGISTKCVM